MSPPRPFSVCVFCGSRHGQHPGDTEQARALGRGIAQRGWRLVYGGGNVGLMGEIADAALQAGGAVLGVIPERLMAREVGHRQLTELHVVGSMHERKQRMAESADAFIALPGGIGTFEELFEVWTWHHLGYHDKPIGLLDAGGFYAPLLAFLRQAVDRGFMDDTQMAMLAVDDTSETLLERLGQAAQAASAGGGDLRRA
jgi:uncharacterized protein (TIGR00730 family)